MHSSKNSFIINYKKSIFDSKNLCCVELENKVIYYGTSNKHKRPA